MKKNIENTFYSLIIGSLILAFLSCKNANKEDQPKQSNPFSGTWIAKDFTQNMIINKAIMNFENGPTEIIIPEVIKDSIIFIVEDVERYKCEAVIKDDKLIIDPFKKITQKAIIKNGNLILSAYDERFRIQEFIKADKPVIKKAKEANTSVLRILINKTLSNNTYISKTSKEEITFTEDGKTKGLANFESFYIGTNGDRANAEDITPITFTSKDGTDKNLGIEFLKDKIELYNLVLLTAPDEKPVYKKGKLLYSLKKN